MAGKRRNDLTVWHRIQYLVRPGDLLFFDGSDDSDLIELIKHVLPNGIEVFTHGDWSHVAMFFNPYTLIENTIDSDANGVQFNDAEQRIVEYDGCNISLFQLSDSTRAALDIQAALDWARSRVGVDRYSIRAIKNYVLRSIGLGHIFTDLRRSKPGESVCSEFITEALLRGHVDRLVGPIQYPNECSPKTVAQWPLYGNITQIAGKAA